MSKLLFRMLQAWRFYRDAVTVYQLHSPFVFQLAQAALEDRRWYYAFDEIEKLRSKAKRSDVELEVTDWGAGASHPGEIKRVKVATLARAIASRPAQGRRLFRIAHHTGAKQMLELGTSLGFGALYLSAIGRLPRLVTLEGSAAVAEVARVHFSMLERHNVTIVVGPFHDTLFHALQRLRPYDLIFFDGNHRMDPTIQYFEASLDFGHHQTVYIFDDIYHSPEMERTWDFLKNHPAVTLSVDFFNLGIVFTNPDFQHKQHFKIISSWKKPWMLW